MLLSIIIPIYNVEPYIERCLHSIFSQSEALREDVVEVIAVNDGTPDRSMDIVEDFARRHQNLHIINQENQGLSCARNAGLDKAVGKYVWFVDSDDCITSDSLAQILPLLMDRNDDLMVMEFAVVETTGIRRRNSAFVKSSYKKHYGKVHNGLFFGKKVGCGIAPRFIFLRSFLNEFNLRFYPGILHEDDELLPRCIHKARRMVCFPIEIYEYHIRKSGSIMNDLKLCNYQDTLILICRHFKLSKACKSRYEKSIFLNVCVREAAWILTSDSKYQDVKAFRKGHRKKLKQIIISGFMQMSVKYYSLGLFYQLLKALVLY